jgi:iron-sulfur cluster assembly accessory protein
MPLHLKGFIKGWLWQQSIKGEAMSEVVQIKNTENIGVTLTDAANQRIVTYLQKNPGNAGVRLSVKKTGCSGLSYVVDFVETPEPTDCIFSQKDNYIVCIDKASYPFLRGLGIDFVKQGLNSKFVFNNPNQTGECGCGESFTVG